MIFGFESAFSSEGLKELFLYRGAVIKKKKSSTVISAEKYHKLILKNNQIDFLEFASSPTKNERRTNEFKELMIKRLHEIPGENSSFDEKNGDNSKNTMEDICWNEQKLADQDQAHFEEEDEKHIEKLIVIARKRRMSALNMPKNIQNIITSAENKKKGKN